MFQELPIMEASSTNCTMAGSRQQVIQKEWLPLNVLISLFTLGHSVLSLWSLSQGSCSVNVKYSVLS